MIITKNGWSPQSSEVEDGTPILGQEHILKDGKIELSPSKFTTLSKNNIEDFYIKENDKAGDGCVKDLMSIPEIKKGYLKIPKVLEGRKIKDIGDFVETGWNVERFRKERNWIEVGLMKLY